MDWYITMIFVEANVIEKGYGGGGLGSWFKVAVSVADLDGTET